MAGSAGGGVRLLQLSGVPAKRTGGGGDFIGMVLLGRRGKEPTICKIPRGAVLFVLGCMACAAAFLAYVLPGMGLTVFLQRVSLILTTRSMILPQASGWPCWQARH